MIIDGHGNKRAAVFWKYRVWRSQPKSREREQHKSAGRNDWPRNRQIWFAFLKLCTSCATLACNEAGAV